MYSVINSFETLPGFKVQAELSLEHQRGSRQGCFKGFCKWQLLRK
jgi:hypothetical protein